MNKINGSLMFILSHPPHRIFYSRILRKHSEFWIFFEEHFFQRICLSRMIQVFRRTAFFLIHFKVIRRIIININENVGRKLNELWYRLPNFSLESKVTWMFERARKYVKYNAFSINFMWIVCSALVDLRWTESMLLLLLFSK